MFFLYRWHIHFVSLNINECHSQSTKHCTQYYDYVFRLKTISHLGPNYKNKKRIFATRFETQHYDLKHHYSVKGTICLNVSDNFM